MRRWLVVMAISLIGTALFSAASEQTLRIGIITDRIPEPKQLSRSLNAVVDPRQFSDIIQQRYARMNPDAEADDFSLADSAEIVSLDLDPSLIEALVARDSVVADYVMRSENLDITLVLVQEPFHSLSRVRVVSFQSDGQITTLFSEVMVPKEVPEQLNQMLIAIVNSFNENRLGAITITNTIAGLQLFLDGNQIDHRDPLMFLSPGTYQLTASAQGMQFSSQTIIVREGEIIPVTLSFEQEKPNPMLITTTSAASSISINGEGMQSVPFVLTDTSPPVVITAIEPRFRPTGIHLIDHQEEILLSLEPVWYTVEHTAIREQRKVYASLGRTLLAGALAILFDTLSRSVAGPRDLWQPMVLAAGGAAAVSFTDTAFRLFAYYQKTQYSSRYWNNEVTLL